jgi:uncharacterized protein YjbI with pentapeptide repeats
MSSLRILLLTIPILFSPPTTVVADEADSLLFTLSVDGPATELGRCIEKGACGGSVNTRRADGLTPLLAAVQANNRQTVLVLLEHGASALKADTMNLDPLYWALYKGYYQIANILFAHGVDVDRPNSQGNSPLASAVMRGDLATATFLLQHGADRARKSQAGLTPRIIASRNHDKPMITLLSSSIQSAPVATHYRSPAEPAGSSSLDPGSTFTDANAVFAAIQSGRRSFRSCSLVGIDLMGMRLDGLDFQGANLSGCDLRDADMRNCDLSGATLRNAFLHGADLRYAHVDNADFGNSMLTASDLRDAVGLSFEQLRSVLNLYKAKLDTETVEIMRRDYPKLFKDPGGAWKAQAKTASKSP